MSERMTGIRLRTSKDAGLADWGRKTPAEMIEQYRSKARYELECAQAILDAKDEDFHVDTFLGPYVRRKREVLQEGLPDPTRANAR